MIRVNCSLCEGECWLLGRTNAATGRMIRANVDAKERAMLGINIIMNWSSSSHEDCGFWFDSDSEGIFLFEGWFIGGKRTIGINAHKLMQ